MAVKDEIIGTDITRPIQLKVAGVPQDLSALANYIVKFYYEDNPSDIIGRFAKTAIPGNTDYVTGKITETDATNGRFTVFIDRNLTVDKHEGRVVAEVRREAVNADFDNDEQRAVKGVAFNLINGNTEGLGNLV